LHGWRKLGRDPRQKRLIASDALDVEQILGLHAYFGGRLLNGATPADFQGERL
jgi:nicotinate phosphoribosyltransferase